MQLNWEFVQDDKVRELIRKNQEADMHKYLRAMVFLNISLKKSH